MLIRLCDVVPLTNDPDQSDDPIPYVLNSTAHAVRALLSFREVCWCDGHSDWLSDSGIVRSCLHSKVQLVERAVSMFLCPLKPIKKSRLVEGGA